MPKVLLIGWDGAGWKQLNPLLDAGAMPNLARLVENGVMGDLAPLMPQCSVLLWTSLATGCYADIHGVLDSTEPDPVTGGVRRATRAGLRVPQIWDLLAREGLRTQVVGWPVTHPAESPSTCVSDGFAHGAPGSVHPPDLAARIEPLRFDPREWTGADLRLFVPDLSVVDQDKDHRLAQLAIVLAEAASAHAAATTLLESAEWDFSAVHFRALGLATEFLGEEPAELYREVLPAVCRFLDLLLGRLVQLAGPDATVLLVSDRAAGDPIARGILCAHGPGIQRDELAFGAGLLDFAPTILGLFGFHRTASMRGSILPEICQVPPQRSLREPSDLTPPAAESGYSAEDDLRELEALGYHDSVAESLKNDAESGRMRRRVNLGLVLLAQERAAEAVPIFEALVADYPAYIDLRMRLAHVYLLAGRTAECRALSGAILSEMPGSPLAPLAEAHLAIAETNFTAARKHLKSSRHALGISAPLDAVIGVACLDAEAWDEAAAAFRSAIESAPEHSAAHEGLAQALLRLGRFEDAAGAALDAVRLRYDRPVAHDILGAALRALGRERDAAGAFAAARELRRRAAAA